MVADTLTPRKRKSERQSFRFMVILCHIGGVGSLIGGERTKRLADSLRPNEAGSIWVLSCLALIRMLNSATMATPVPALARKV